MIKKMENNSLFMKKLYGLDDEETKEAFEYIYKKSKAASEDILNEMISHRDKLEKELNGLKSTPRRIYLDGDINSFKFEDWARNIFNIRVKIDELNRNILSQQYNISELFTSHINPSEILHEHPADGLVK